MEIKLYKGMEKKRDLELKKSSSYEYLEATESPQVEFLNNEGHNISLLMTFDVLTDSGIGSYEFENFRIVL